MAIPYSRTIFGSLSWYSVLIIVGILAAVWLAEREEKRLSLPKDTAVDLALASVPSGIIGARLYYVAMTWEQFAADPIRILYVWEGGIAIYGAVIGGALGVLCYAKIKKLPFWRLLDILAPGLLLAQAIGRWGNYFNMEAYGPEIQNTLFQFFPAGVLIPGSEGYTWHMATFFYESFWNFCGFWALWRLRKRQKEPGSVFAWYLLIYGSGRFIIEQLRMDSLYLGGFRVSQMLSLVLCAASAGVLLYRAASGRKRQLLLGAIGALALIFRWFFLENAWLYGAALLLAAGLYLLMEGRNGKKTWLLLAFLLFDLAGLLYKEIAPSSFALRLHTLLCSLTLPLLVGWSLSKMKNTEEGSACRTTH
ncbi:MAG: prolipoprotein diacylglyceryl transferase [Eubacteriales bacterium]|nr:prolipoprotein diacylglyceryl transferase [Eubacteriales bacterium]